MTYNNLACYYRKLGHLRSALIYLEKALDLEKLSSHTAPMADTHLNTCAVLSQLDRHDLALLHAH
jgi:tetratricopeptide (TPR) repeat protein